MTFTIDPDNNITAYADAPEAAANIDTFTSEKALTKLTAEWPAARLVEVWNSFAGVTPFDDLKPVRKFTDRASAVSRIWKAVQRLSPVAAPQTEPVAPEQPESDNGATSANAAPTVREGSKKQIVLDLMRRPEGATLAEIMSVTSWQKHTIRGFVAGTVTKKLGLTVESLKRDQERVYRIPA